RFDFERFDVTDNAGSVFVFLNSNHDEIRARPIAAGRTSALVGNLFDEMICPTLIGGPGLKPLEEIRIQIPFTFFSRFAVWRCGRLRSGKRLRSTNTSATSASESYHAVTNEIVSDLLVLIQRPTDILAQNFVFYGC